MKKTLLTALSTALIASAAHAQDTCAAAIALPAGDNVGVVVDTTAATDSGVQPSCGSGVGILDSWYSWSPTLAVADCTFTTCDIAAFDTRIALHSSCGGAEIACNDDGPGCTGFTSTLVAPGLTNAATYFIQVGGWNPTTVGTGTMDVTESAPPPPGFFASDECATATAIPSGEQLLMALDTTGATASAEVSACDGATAGGAGAQHDVWLSWSPDCSGDYTISTCSLASFDTNIGLWSSACAAEAACEEDTSGCAGFSTTLSALGLSGGTTYAIRIGGWGAGEEGMTDVDIAYAGVLPANDECATATVLPAGAQTLVGIDTCLATTSVEASACDGATAGGAGVQNDLWYEWSPDVDGIWIVSTCNISAVDTNLGIWTGCATELLCDEDTGGCAGFTTELAAVLSSATTYQIRLGGWGAGDSGISDLDISQAPLTNDECEAPTVISGAGTTTFDSTGATASASSGLASDVWYEWTPDFAGDYNFSTCSQADFDTLIVLWNACPLAAGTPLGFNDDGPGCAGFTSDLDVAGLNTIPYYIAVSGFGGATGTGDLTITCTSCVPPANNDCAGATPMIEGANAHDHGNFSTASGQDATGLPPFVDTDTPDTACEVFNATPDALNIDNWYSFTAPANSGYVFDACDSASYDSKLAIYSGACGSLTALACNDDGTGCTGFTSTLQVTGLSAGQTYLVQVGGFGAADAGTATINVSRRSGTQNYCTTAANSVGAGAVMASSGSTSIAADDLVVECSGLPDDFAIFFFGAAKDNTQNAGFNGVHCVSNPIRLPAVILVAGGSASRAVTNAELGGPGAGNTVFFQCFYRDHGNLGNGANTSDAIAVTLGL